MHGTTNIKFIDTKQAEVIFQFKNVKKKLYKTNAAMWYNNVGRIINAYKKNLAK